MRYKLLALGVAVLFASSSASAWNEGSASSATPAVKSAISALKADAHVKNVKIFWKKGMVAPRMISGTLSAPSTLPAREVAVSFLKKHADLFRISDTGMLREKIVLPTRAGSVVRFHQQIDGIPVKGAVIAVRVDSNGSVRQVVNGLVDANGISTNPLVTAEHALDVLFADEARYYPVSVPEDVAVRLVLLALPAGGAELCWELHTGAVVHLLSNWYVYVSAETGEIVYRENRMWFDRQAWVFENNPVHTPDEKKVTLDLPLDYVPDSALEIRTICDDDVELEDGGIWTCECTPPDCLWLAEPLFVSKNCVDLHEVVHITFMGDMDLHMCSQIQATHGDENNDFIYSPRTKDGDLDELNPEDKFTEVQMYYHMNKIYDFFDDLSDRAKGNDNPVQGDEWTGMAVAPMMATVNFQLPFSMTGGMPSPADLEKAADPYGELEPFDNAMFMPGGGGGIPGFSSDTDQMVFGQGTACDFSWDGDVIYHEFTHGVTNSIADGLGWWAVDDWGSIMSPGAMNEGFSDFFPAVVTDEPTMGEYSLAKFGSANVRELENEDQCPWYFMGESHHDSTGWSGGMWDGLNLIAGGDRDTELDVASMIMAAESMFPLNSTFTEAAEIVLQVIEDELGADARDSMQEGFDNHQMYHCPRFFDMDDTGGRTVPGLQLPSTADLGLDNWAPGMAQYLKNIPGAGVESVTFEAQISAGMATMGFGEGDPEPVLLIKTGEDRLNFTYEGKTAVADTDIDAFDMEENPQKPQYTFTYEPEGGIPGGKVWFMVVNKAENAGTVSRVSISLGKSLPEPEDAGSGAVDESDAGTDGGGTEEEGGGGDCGCTQAGRHDADGINVLINLIKAVF